MALKNAAKIGVPATSKKSAQSRKSNHTRVKIPHIPLDMPGRYSTGNVMAVKAFEQLRSGAINDKQFLKHVKRK